MASSAGDAQHDSSTDAGRPQKATKRKRTVATTTTTERTSRSNDRLQPDQPSIHRQRAASGSSRDTMISSGTPPNATGLKYTRTGRVSKAFKGERVHGCDECGKVYTRAEHLRRHKKNHSPGQLPCDIPGCGRSFFREDLLLRHKQRHNEPNTSPLRHGSTDGQVPGGYGQRTVSYGGESTTSTSPFGTTRNGPPDSMEMLLPNHGRSGSLGSSFGQSKNYTTRPLNAFNSSPITINGYKPLPHTAFDTTRISAAMPVNGSTYATSQLPSEVQWQPQTSARYTSPLSPRAQAQAPYYQPPERHARTSVDSTMLEATPADSVLPVIATSGEEWNPPFGSISTPSSDVSHSDPQRYPTHTRRVSGIAVQFNTPEERDLMEQMDLQTPTIGMTSPDFGPHMDLSVFDSEQRYITAYWQAVHSIWPFVHRGHFNFSTASPLLRAAMITLGAQSTGDATDLSNARILHERCLKVLKKRTNNCTHTYRICDMQAIVLVEIYSLFKSRRPPLQPSSCFEDVFRQLSHDPQAYPPSELDAGMTMQQDFGGINSSVAIEVQREAKLRLLIACYVLERQHSVFFGRRASNCLSVPGEQLPFPKPLSDWDADYLNTTEASFDSLSCDQTQYEYTYQVLSVVPQLQSAQTLPFDIFRSLHLIACLDDVDQGRMLSTWQPIDDIEASALLATLDQSPRTRLAYHMFSLCKKSHVRDLLAVAGESWVMAEKITSQAEYKQAQVTIGNWARAMHDGSNGTQRSALCHALRIIDIHRTHARTGLLFQDWALYLATIVVWISSYVQCNSGPRRRIGGSSTPPTQHELERTVIAVTEAGSSVPITWRDACSILLWTKSKLDQINIPHNCGLTNGALDVLEKLVNRGHEDTWLS